MSNRCYDRKANQSKSTQKSLFFNTLATLVFEKFQRNIWTNLLTRKS